MNCYLEKPMQSKMKPSSTEYQQTMLQKYVRKHSPQMVANTPREETNIDRSRIGKLKAYHVQQNCTPVQPAKIETIIIDDDDDEHQASNPTLKRKLSAYVPRTPKKLLSKSYNPSVIMPLELNRKQVKKLQPTAANTSNRRLSMNELYAPTPPGTAAYSMTNEQFSAYVKQQQLQQQFQQQFQQSFRHSLPPCSIALRTENAPTHKSNPVSKRYQPTRTYREQTITTAVPRLEITTPKKCSSYSIENILSDKFSKEPPPETMKASSGTNTRNEIKIAAAPRDYHKPTVIRPIPTVANPNKLKATEASNSRQLPSPKLVTDYLNYVQTMQSSATPASGNAHFKHQYFRNFLSDSSQAEYIREESEYKCTLEILKQETDQRLYKFYEFVTRMQISTNISPYTLKYFLYLLKSGQLAAYKEMYGKCNAIE